MAFVSLHTHSHYSVMDGLGTPEQIVAKAKELGMPAVAITDHGNMNAYAYLYKHARRAGIKPIMGCEFYIVPSLAKWRRDYAAFDEKGKIAGDERVEARKALRDVGHMVLLVKNAAGFRNINLLLNEASRNAYYTPRIDREMLKAHCNGLICCTACMHGEIPRMLLAEEFTRAGRAVEFYKGIFGDDFYVEVQFNEIPNQDILNQRIVSLADNAGVKIVVTTDSHYLRQAHAATHQTLLLLRTKKTYADIEAGENVFKFSAQHLFFKGPEDVMADCRQWSPWLVDRVHGMMEETGRVADKVEAFEIGTEIKLKDTDPSVIDKDGQLLGLCVAGLKRLGLEMRKAYLDRMRYELSVIGEKKLANYFLVIAKIVSDARRKMFVGCGRGSGAGSLVNYLLGITTIDPLRYGLYFERFLAVDRKDYPDIDIDFEDNDAVKTKLMEEYPGEVACITAYSTFQVSGLLRDLGRVYGIKDSSFFSALSKEIRRELLEKKEESPDAVGYGRAYQLSPTFRKFMDENPKVARDAEALSEQIRHVGKHAAGVVICDRLTELQPTMVIDGAIQTSLSEGTRDKTLADFGFVKIDVLGLTTLRIMHEVVSDIATRDGRTPGSVYAEIRADRIDTEIPEIYGLIFHELRLLGIFQFETDSIRGLIEKVRPTCFEDLAAINALFRPGPLQGGIAFEYGDRKKNPKGIDYLGSAVVKRVLEPTFGILIYQEQIMELGHLLGGLTLAETNVMRKLLVKRNKVEGDIDAQLGAMKDKFLVGAVMKGMEEANAIHLWGMMEKFSGYGFNKAHAVSYAMIAYQCAYLKWKYPLEFYKALMNSETQDNYQKIATEMRKWGYGIRLADINASGKGFTIRGREIFWGLENVKGVGGKAAEEIVKNQPFTDFGSFLRAGIDWRVVNKRAVITLINAGAFSSIAKRGRAWLAAFYEEYNTRKNHKTRDETWNQQSAIDCARDSVQVPGEYTDAKLMELEQELYGMTISASPFDAHKDTVERVVASGYARENIMMFTDIAVKKDKRGRDMAFVTVMDVAGDKRPALVFSSNWERMEVKKGRPYYVSGKWDGKLMIDKAVDLYKINTQAPEE